MRNLKWLILFHFLYSQILICFHVDITLLLVFILLYNHICSFSSFALFSPSKGFRAMTDSDPRAASLVKKILVADLCEEEQLIVLDIVQMAYEKYVLHPTKSSWRKEDKQDPVWSRKMLEREVERTSMREMALFIKKELDTKLQPLWHVAYGRSFSAFVSYEKMSFIQCSIDGAEVVAWRHGR